MVDNNLNVWNSIAENKINWSMIPIIYKTNEDVFII